MPSRLGRSNMVSSRIPSMIERRPRAPVLRSMALRAMAPSASSASVRSINSISNSRLLHQRVLGLGENKLEGRLVEVLERGHHEQSADEFRDQAVLQEILRLDLTENFTSATVFRRNYLGAEADRGRPPASGNDLLQAGEGAAAHEQDVGSVDLQEFLLWVLAPALRRHRRDRAFHDPEQGLLHALARDVAGNRGVVGLAADLVDRVDIDDATLGALDIVVGGLQQLEDDVLDVLADIAGFGERGGISHG